MSSYEEAKVIHTPIDHHIHIYKTLLDAYEVPHPLQELIIDYIGIDDSMNTFPERVRENILSFVVRLFNHIDSYHMTYIS